MNSAVMNDNILSVDHLMMHFGGIKALNDVNLDVKRGSITALIGPNGAGKTTVFNCLTGFYKATGGSISLNTRRDDHQCDSGARAEIPARRLDKTGAARQTYFLQNVWRHASG